MNRARYEEEFKGLIPREAASMTWSVAGVSETSYQDLFHIDTRDSYSLPSLKCERACLQIHNPHGAAWMYMQAPPGVPYEKYRATITVEIFGDCDGSIWLEYDSTDQSFEKVAGLPGAFKPSAPQKMRNIQQWQVFCFEIDDCCFQKRINGADFRIVCPRRRSVPIFVKSVRLNLDPGRANHFPAAYQRGPSMAINLNRTRNPLASIVIPVYNRIEFTHQCLDYLGRHTAEIDYEVIVVDDGSSQENLAILRKLDGIRLVEHRTNEGFARACNDGAARARGRYLVFLNNDTVPKRNWLSEMIDCHERNDQAGVVGSKLLYPGTGFTQHAGVSFDANGAPYHIHTHMPSGHELVDTERESAAVTGACLFTPRSLFESLNGFDQHYHNSCEDIDYCLRVRRAGYRIYYSPLSELFHYESVSDGRLDNKSQFENLDRFLSLWKSEIVGGNLVPIE